MPLAPFVAEVMGLLAQSPTPEESCVQRVDFLRRAEAEGRFDALFGMLNGETVVQGSLSAISIRREVDANSRRASTASVRTVVTISATGPISQPSEQSAK